MSVAVWWDAAGNNWLGRLGACWTVQSCHSILASRSWTPVVDEVVGGTWSWRLADAPGAFFLSFAVLALVARLLCCRPAVQHESWHGGGHAEIAAGYGPGQPQAGGGACGSGVPPPGGIMVNKGGAATS